MQPGPRHEPTALKILKGNPGKHALPANEPKPNEGIPEQCMPLDAYALVVRERYCRILTDLHVLTIADGIMLDSLCQAESDYARHTDALRRLGETYDTE